MLNITWDTTTWVLFQTREYRISYSFVIQRFISHLKIVTGCWAMTGPSIAPPVARTVSTSRDIWTRAQPVQKHPIRLSSSESPLFTSVQRMIEKTLNFECENDFSLSPVVSTRGTVCKGANNNKDSTTTNHRRQGPQRFSCLPYNGNTKRPGKFQSHSEKVPSSTGDFEPVASSFETFNRLSTTVNKTFKNCRWTVSCWITSGAWRAAGVVDTPVVFSTWAVWHSLCRWLLAPFLT